MKILLAIVMLTGGVLLYRMTSQGRSDELQGRWTIQSAPEGWKIAPAMDIMVTSDEIQIRLGTVITSRMHYTADYEERILDVTTPGGELRRGIYRLDDDVLTLCVGAEKGPRPDTPDVTGEGTMRWVLKRGALQAL